MAAAVGAVVPAAKKIVPASVVENARLPVDADNGSAVEK